MKLEVGKRYVRRDGMVTDYLRPIISTLYPYHDPKAGLVYTAQGRNDIDSYSLVDLVKEYIDPSPTPQQDTLPAEPVPGKWYKTRGGHRAYYVGKTTSKYVYEVVYGMSEGLKNYSCPFTFGTGTYVSDLDIISEWKESVALPPVEIKRWARVQAVDTKYTKRGEVLGVSEFKVLLEEKLEEDEELVELTGILPSLASESGRATPDSDCFGVSNDSLIKELERIKNLAKNAWYYPDLKEDFPPDLSTFIFRASTIGRADQDIEFLLKIIDNNINTIVADVKLRQLIDQCITEASADIY